DREHLVTIPLHPRNSLVMCSRHHEARACTRPYRRARWGAMSLAAACGRAPVSMESQFATERSCPREMPTRSSLPRLGMVLGLLVLLAVPGVLVAAGAGYAQERLPVDLNLPAYQPQSGVEGTVSSVGSDTLNNLMALWSEGFRTYYPSVQMEIEGKGSSTAPPALIAG